MAAYWPIPDWMKKYMDGRIIWRERFVWWPQYSNVSNQRIWFKRAWYGYRLIEGLAGEEPLKDERWMTQEEYDNTSSDTIESIKQQRYNDWLAIINAMPTEPDSNT